MGTGGLSVLFLTCTRHRAEPAALGTGTGRAETASLRSSLAWCQSPRGTHTATRSTHGGQKCDGFRERKRKEGLPRGTLLPGLPVQKLHRRPSTRGLRGRTAPTRTAEALLPDTQPRFLAPLAGPPSRRRPLQLVKSSMFYPAPHGPGSTC